MCYKNEWVKACILIWPILIVFQQPPNYWLLYFVKIRTKYARKERFFSFNHILLCSFILSAIYNALKSVNVLLSVNAISMLLWTSLTVNHTCYISAMWVSKELCSRSFETVIHCRYLKFHLFNKWLTGRCTCFVVVGNSWDSHTLWLSSVK